MSANEGDKPSDERLIRDAQRLLQAGTEELDAATLSRLNRARQRALTEFGRHGRRPAWLGTGWRPALGVAAVAVVAVALWTGRLPAPGSPQPGLAPSSAATQSERAVDIELMLADENLEMIEDLEFYDWLEADLPVEAAPSPGLSG